MLGISWLILYRGRKRAPNLRPVDRILAVCALLQQPARLFRSAIVISPSTLLIPSSWMKKQKYRCCFRRRGATTGTEGPPTGATIEAFVT